jgi:hypothetical protein
MSAAILREKLTHHPFQPFRVVMSSGDVYDVPHPEMALLVRSGIFIAVPDSAGELPEVPVWCGFLHVAAIEPVANGASPASSGGISP